MTATLIKELRDSTGCGIEQCAKALEKCEGSIELAKHYLKYRGMAVAVKKDGKSVPNEQWAWEQALKDWLK